MTYPANVIEIIIASPSDVADERQIVREIIAEWNVMYARERGVVLLPLGWETHSAPELSGRPQQIINDRLLRHADILVGIFWTRVGSPTGKAISGSLEEIAEHRSKGKPAMLYFSNAPTPPTSIDREQYEQLTDFKSWAQAQGLVEGFSSGEDFREKFRRQLPLLLHSNAFLRPLLDQRNDWPLPPQEPEKLSSDAMELLTAAANHQKGLVMISRTLGGTDIKGGGQSFGDPKSRRVVAYWEAIVSDLLDRGLIKDANGRGEYFQVTNAGYRLAGIE